jgi:hypothetical protein
MPRKSFDTTAFQQKINEYMREMQDIYTKEELTESYSKFCEAVFRLKALTDYFYTPDSEGKLMPVDNKSRLEILNAYKDAISEASSFAGVEDTGEVGIAMKGIADELLPLMRLDYDALSQVDDKKSMPLPELISAGRRELVDFEDQAMVTAGGNVNQRMHIKVRDENGKVTEEGYFTPTVIADPEKDAREILVRLSKKYGPNYGRLLKKLYDSDLSKYFKDTFMAWDSADPFVSMEQTDKQEAVEHLDDIWFSCFYNRMELNEEANEVLNEPRFEEFSHELFSSLKVCMEHYRQFFGQNGYINVEKGANIDKRNIAFYRMACLLGKPDLVAAAKPMTIGVNGQKITGTFMAEAHGVDITKVKDGDEILDYKPEVYDNPDVFDDIAAMQALDFIGGNTDRHMGNLFMRFNPKDAEHAKLVGLTLIDNDMTFSDASEDGRFEGLIKARQMGVVGYDFYKQMCLMTREQLHVMLADCGLSNKEIDMAWDRKEYLQKKIEADIEYFKDKAPGYTEKGRIRLVKKEEWSSYKLKDLAETHRESKFRFIHETKRTALVSREMVIQDKLKEEKRNEIKKLVGIPVEEKKADQPIPEGHVVTIEPVKLDEREAEIKLVIPRLTSVKSMGNVLSKRYLLSFEEGDKTKEVFFTPEQNSGIRSDFIKLIDSNIEKHPEYKDVLLNYRDYYMSDDNYEYSKIPIKPHLIPYEEFGISQERRDALMTDRKFENLLSKFNIDLSKLTNRNIMSEMNGLQLGEGRRIELRNVAMSDVCDSLGLEGVLAKTRTAKVMCEGQIIEGVVMDRADGYDLGVVRENGNHPMAQIPKEKIDEVYNTPEGLKSIADLYITDYISLNLDRHEENLMYRFSGMDTGNPRFLGVVGIDNDCSFSIQVPKDDEPVNKLHPLDSMKVISKEAADSIMAPGYFDNLAKKLKERGLSEAEINAAKTRVEMVKERIQDGRMRIVARDEWAKGENTLQKLAEEEDSIFSALKENAFEAASKIGKSYNNKNKRKGAELKPYVEKELKFTKCAKVDDFGRNALRSEELRKLEHQAELDFRDRIGLAVFSAQVKAKLTDREMLDKIKSESAELMSLLSKADPVFSFTSGTYKDLRKAAKELHELAGKLKKKYKDPNSVVSDKDSNKLNLAFNKVFDKSAAYNLKKAAETARGEELTENGQHRVEASTRTSSVVNSLKNEYEAVIINRNATKDPMKEVRRRMGVAQGALSGKTGNELHENVAEVLFFKGFLRLDKENKSIASLKNALDPEHVKLEIEGIMNTPGWRELAKLPEDRLRSMAAEKNAEKLLKQYIKETAKCMKQANDKAKHQAARPKQNAPVNPKAGK